MKLPLAALGLGIALVGCQKDNTSLFPLEPGKSWSYAVRSGEFLSTVDELKVVDRIAVGGTEGWLIRGSMGESRVAWIDGYLVAETLPGSRFSPPIPLLDSRKPKSQRHWQGLITFDGSTRESIGDLTQITETIELGGRKLDTIRSELTLQLPKTRIEQITWYARDIGVVRQEQRVNGARNRALSYLSGP